MLLSVKDQHYRAKTLDDDEGKLRYERKENARNAITLWKEFKYSVRDDIWKLRSEGLANV